jgi:peptidoglycan/xylan/chitin deacetylase (PgdA/CDA1 family)
LNNKPSIALTVDLEDYRFQQLRDVGMMTSMNPAEVEYQAQKLLDVFEMLNLKATFFTVGQTAETLPASLLERIAKNHEVGCHSYAHLPVWRLGKAKFHEDTYKAKQVLEHLFSKEVVSYRAPYFSCQGCDPWFGEILAEFGFHFDSSKRLDRMPANSQGAIPLEGSSGKVIEIPLSRIGFGPKALTVIGGTYFRLLPLSVIVSLLKRSKELGFMGLIYLHPHDIDPIAPWLQLKGFKIKDRLGDWIRRIGRSSAFDKLTALTHYYDLVPMEGSFSKVNAI